MPSRIRHLLVAALPLCAVLVAAPASACSPVEGWRPPTAPEAFRGANLVVYGVVESLRIDGMHTIAKLGDLRILKGAGLPESEVRTVSSAMCGIDTFEIGRAYLLFLRGAEYSVGFLGQPGGDPASLLAQLQAAGLLK